ncbi:hypothetical protein DPX16_20945 [Anabarilius grahami]|uniref:Uncharacterized protein n=1 Tax=Anabarilius grahami TaxID=495550 RepID=A0A3N0XQJ1_ANAGA|nr:hypothetical protein DPX16_20945 [Anabarilius grahami]
MSESYGMTVTKARAVEGTPACVGPQGSIAKYVEWVLVQCGSSFTICPVEEDNASPTLDPEPSQPSAMPALEQKPEPTEDSEPEPITNSEPEQLESLKELRE